MFGFYLILDKFGIAKDWHNFIRFKKMKDDLKQVFVEKEKIFLNKLNFLKRIGTKLSESDC